MNTLVRFGPMLIFTFAIVTSIASSVDAGSTGNVVRYPTSRRASDGRLYYYLPSTYSPPWVCFQKYRNGKTYPLYYARRNLYLSPRILPRTSTSILIADRNGNKLYWHRKAGERAYVLVNVSKPVNLGSTVSQRSSSSRTARGRTYVPGMSTFGYLRSNSSRPGNTLPGFAGVARSGNSYGRVTSTSSSRSITLPQFMKCHMIVAGIDGVYVCGLQITKQGNNKFEGEMTFRGGIVKGVKGKFVDGYLDLVVDCELRSRRGSTISPIRCLSLSKVDRSTPRGVGGIWRDGSTSGPIDDDYGAFYLYKSDTTRFKDERPDPYQSTFCATFLERFHRKYQGHTAVERDLADAATSTLFPHLKQFMRDLGAEAARR